MNEEDEFIRQTLELFGYNPLARDNMIENGNES